MNIQEREDPAEKGNSYCDDFNRKNDVDRNGQNSKAVYSLTSHVPTGRTSSHRATANWIVRHHNLSRCIVPSDFDILLGRGRKFRDHPANKRLRHLVHQFWEKYEDCCREEKTDLSKQIVQMVKTGGATPARFLKLNKATGSWVEIDDELARLKVSHVFRDYKRGKQFSSKIVDSTNTTASGITGTYIENESPPEPSISKAPSVPQLQSPGTILKLDLNQEKKVAVALQPTNQRQNFGVSMSEEEVASSCSENLNHLSRCELVTRNSSLLHSFHLEPNEATILQHSFNRELHQPAPDPIAALAVMNTLLWRPSQISQPSQFSQPSTIDPFMSSFSLVSNAFVNPTEKVCLLGRKNELQFNLVQLPRIDNDSALYQSLYPAYPREMEGRVLRID